MAARLVEEDAAGAPLQHDGQLPARRGPGLELRQRPGRRDAGDLLGRVLVEVLEADGEAGRLHAGLHPGVAAGHAVHEHAGADLVVLGEQPVGVRDEDPAPAVGVADGDLADRVALGPGRVVGPHQHVDLAGLLDALGQDRDLVGRRVGPAGQRDDLRARSAGARQPRTPPRPPRAGRPRRGRRCGRSPWSRPGRPGRRRPARDRSAAPRPCRRRTWRSTSAGPRRRPRRSHHRSPAPGAGCVAGRTLRSRAGPPEVLPTAAGCVSYAGAVGTRARRIGVVRPSRRRTPRPRSGAATSPSSPPRASSSWPSAPPSWRFTPTCGRARRPSATGSSSTTSRRSRSATRSRPRPCSSPSKGRRLTFRVSVKHRDGLVAAGRITRVVVERSRFLGKAAGSA